MTIRIIASQKIGHAYPREREDRSELSSNEYCLTAGDHAHGHTDQDRDEHGERRELERGRQASEELVVTGRPVTMESPRSPLMAR